MPPRTLGFGLGLRAPYLERFLTGRFKPVEWVEVISENYFTWKDCETRRAIYQLEKVREALPVALHGVCLSVGSTDPLDPDYLRRLQALAQRIEPCWVSDHLCWGGVGGHKAHDLLPLPYSKKALCHVASRIQQVQETLGRPLLIENVSSYVEFKQSEMPEWEFLSEVVRRSGCQLLLDVNNVFVSATNHRFDPLEYLQAVPADRVVQFHLAGHSDLGTHRIDTHDAPVCSAVWELYRYCARRFPNASTLIEWDDHFPSWEDLIAEVLKAKRIWSEEHGVAQKTAARVPKKLAKKPVPSAGAPIGDSPQAPSIRPATL